VYNFGPIPEAKTDFPQQFLLCGCRTLVCLALAAPALAQSPPKSPPAGSGLAERGVDLAAKNRCEEALPLLKAGVGRARKELRYRALMATVRCGLNRREDRTTVDALLDLRREFPEDPEVLYMTSQVFLDIAERASQELASIAPDSYQTLELQAETLESQEKWSEAAKIYQKILVQHPSLRGMHYKLGRALVSDPDSPNGAEEAGKEFEQELAVDPNNAAAEYWLGEIARRQGQWDAAIRHFATAAKLNSNFADALLALGSAYNSAGRHAEAVPPLEQYVKMSPEALAGHYQLYIAYVRTGRSEESNREMTIHQQLLEKKRAKSNSRSDAPPH